MSRHPKPTSRVRKAVFPVAGLGTRFLPATKASPKEMLPVVDKPLIQYAVEEALAAGIEDLVFINGRNKRSIPDHFDKAYELEQELERKGKLEMLERVRGIVPPHASCIYIRQAEALGLGHAVLCARPVIGDEPFAVILADDMIDGGQMPVLKQMLEVYERFGASMLAVEHVPGGDIRKYGVVKPEPGPEPDLTEVAGLVEKPAPEEAPSDLGVVGRYVLNPRIFDLLQMQVDTGNRGAGGEIQLTDAIASMLAYERIYAYAFQGTRYDCGSKLGYLKANVEMGLKHADLGDALRGYLRESADAGRF